MAKCRKCGKSGLMLKLTNGLCDNCIITEQMEHRQAELAGEISKLYDALKDKQALYNKIEEDAKASALEKLKSEERTLATRVEVIKLACVASQRELDILVAQQEDVQKSVASSLRKIQKGKELAKSLKYAREEFDSTGNLSNIGYLINEAEAYLSPSVTLSLQCLNMKELRKRYRENEKAIQAVFDNYKSRYTTKSYIAIYQLMVIALSAELQNILHDIRYGKLEDSLAKVRTVTEKYYVITTAGNQSIAPTLKKFIGELEYFFQEAVKIEYEYYVQKERAKEEQRAIREQMRQEAEERRELERQQKQIEKEESKFAEQIAQLREKLDSADSDMAQKYEARIQELTQQLAEVSLRKERIIHLQNGKAGHVYVISNLGAFGDSVFKIGMTRREDPLERVRELGSASVPFPFDVHATIFSDDAVSLEYKLHQLLNDRRVNKVNLRKEFFNIGLDELEQLVLDICPTAEFNCTMIAEQYRQSLSIDHIDYIPENDPDEEDDIL